MGNILSYFQPPRIENSGINENFESRHRSISLSKGYADCSISPSEGYASGSLATVETINEVQNIQLVHYGISKENQRKIKQMFIRLKDNIDIDGILDHFIEDGDLTEDAQERIVYNNPRRKQVEIFLFRLFRFKRDAFKRFVQYIREDECLVHVADQLQKGIKLPALQSTRLKPREIRAQIEQHQEHILQQIEPEEIAEYLIVYEVCEVNEFEQVVSHFKTSREKGLALLELIQRHLPRGYQVFLTALKELNRTGLLQTLQKRHFGTQGQNIDITRSGVTANLTYGNQSDLSSLVQQVGGHSGYSLRCTRATQCDEEDLVENFRSETVKAKINRRLIPETNTMLYDTISGSLIFHLKWTSQAWRQLSVDRLREVVGTVVSILMEEGSKEVTESQTWNVEVCAIPSTLNVRPSTTDPKDAVKVITENEEFLATELNGLRMAEEMNRCGVLSSDDLSDIRKKSDRKTRAEGFLNKITSRGETSAEAFLENLKKAGSRYHFITRHLWPENDEDLCWMANNMETIYPYIMECLPQVTLSQCQRELGLPDECVNNEDAVLTATQYIMKQGNEIKLRFLLMLLEKEIVHKDLYTSIRSNMSHDNIASDEKPPSKNTPQTDTTARVQLGQCIVVKENDAKGYQAEKCAGTIDEHGSFLSTIHKYLSKLIFCGRFVDGSTDKLRSARPEPTPTACVDYAYNANNAEICESRDERTHDEGYFTARSINQSRQSLDSD